jgi:hypothetical protein
MDLIGDGDRSKNIVEKNIDNPSALAWEAASFTL